MKRRSIVFTLCICLGMSGSVLAQQFSGPNNTTDPISRTGQVTLGFLDMDFIAGAGGGPGGWGRASTIKLRTQNAGQELAIGCDGTNFYIGRSHSGISLQSLILDANVSNTGTFRAWENGTFAKDLDVNGILIVGNRNTMNNPVTGVLPANYNMFVQNGILTERLTIALRNTSDWADYVFSEEYQLRPLKEVEEFIRKHQHLPGIPSAVEVLNSGIDVAKMNVRLLEKIEELTLYIIEQNRILEDQNNRIKLLESKN